jgi:hypothetical protein
LQGTEEPDAVLRIGNLVRVREDALMRWITGQGVAGSLTGSPTDDPDDGAAPDAA